MRCARDAGTNSERFYFDFRYRAGPWKPETPSQLFALQMAERDRQSIGGIGRFGEFAHLQERANHSLHLALIGVAVTGDASFYFARGIAVNNDTALGGGQEDDAADFGETERGAHV